MSNYNLLTAEMICPRCGNSCSMTIELHFGMRDQIALRIGSLYPWNEGKSVIRGGRPEGGSIDGEGYAQCPCCGKDFFVVVGIRNDLIVSAHSNTTKQPYIPE
jgi:hypothetical protein